MIYHFGILRLYQYALILITRQKVKSRKASYRESCKNCKVSSWFAKCAGGCSRARGLLWCRSVRREVSTLLFGTLLFGTLPITVASWETMTATVTVGASVVARLWWDKGVKNQR